MKTKFPIIEFTLMALMAFLIAVSCGKPGTITKTVIKTDTLFTEENTGFVEWEYGYKTAKITRDTIYKDKDCPNAPTFIKARKIKQKRSNNTDNSIHLKNCFNENIDLKKSVLLYKSQADSLQNILNGKKPIGEQTNMNNKWWIWLLVGIGVGAISYQGIRSAITKKI